MAKKFTETPIPMIGKELYFDRCPMNTLRKYDEQIQEKIKELDPLTNASDALQEEESSLLRRIEGLQRKVDLIEMKDDPSDKDIDNAMKAIDKQEGLYDELKEIRKQITEHDETNEEDYRRIQDEMNQIIAEKVEAMLKDITAEEFLENYDAVDMKVATYLSRYYEMCILGERESKIRKAIQEDIAEQNERIKSFRR